MNAAYYNEFDTGAAAWLRDLIKRGLIADGEVDERSILDVRPVDIIGFTQCHFFAGIGGWSYALRLAGWPDDRPVWTGSPPCQPFSAAGKQRGKDDERHLAPHWTELVAVCRPPVIFGEQVASAAVFGKSAKRTGSSTDGALEWAWLDDLFDRLEAARYACGASDIPAASVGAPHIRQRTFFGAVRLADADDAGSQGRVGVPERAGERASWSGSLEGGLEYAQSDGWIERRTEPSGRGTSGGCGDLGLADANGGNTGTERQQRGGEHGQQSQDGGDSRMANSDCRERDGITEHQWDERDRQDFGRAKGERQPEPCCDNNRSSTPHSPWRDPDWLFCRDGKWRPVEPSVLGLADGVPAELVRSGAFVPASSPLAQSSKEARRVMRLRGYGNAIVPQAAAEFIAAFEGVASACAEQWGGHAEAQEARHG